LFRRVKESVDNPAGYAPAEALRFDGFDLVIFDNNLSELEFDGARLTAESMVGYVRAFSDCPYCVSLNKNPDVGFDLRYLVGDHETRADLALNTDHLENRGLWTGRQDDALDGFLPWYWPALADVPERRREQVRFVQERLMGKVLSSLGLPEAEPSLSYLSRHGRGALVPSKSAGDWLFIDMFLERDRSLPAESLDSRKALASSAAESEPVAEVVARVIAADLDLWFRRDLVAPQEMLVDVPHLVMRMPFLLAGDPSETKAWQDAVASESAPFGLDAEIYRAQVAKARFQHGMWVPRPMFLWPLLKENEVLDDLFFKAASSETEIADVVFCEDRSMFAPRVPGGDQSPPREFTAEFEGASARRVVAVVPGYEYRPWSRFVD
jgi:hypothetical protein